MFIHVYSCRNAETEILLTHNNNTIFLFLFLLSELVHVFMRYVIKKPSYLHRICIFIESTLKTA